MYIIFNLIYITLFYFCNYTIYTATQIISFFSTIQSYSKMFIYCNEKELIKNAGKYKKTS